MKNKILITVLFILFINNLYSQTVERLICTSEMNDLNYNYNVETGDGSPSPHPTEFYVSEVANDIFISTSSLQKSFIVNENVIRKETYNYYQLYKGYYKYPGFIFACSDTYIEIISLNERNKYSGMVVSGGISFVLKKDEGYIIFGVNESGHPVAIDTFGKKYNSREAMEYLKEYDPEKYDRSVSRAKELGLKGKFDLYEVLIWGDTYYDTVRKLENHWNSRQWLYLTISSPINYDMNGYGYQFLFSKSSNSLMVCINPDGNWEFEAIELKKYSNILNKKGKDSELNAYWIVMPTGNAYYLISDKTETEVFRIRNTWDSTNLYALAINGYTEDFYGDYVKEVLPKMSKADLRLLRNTIFALYGVHFKSEDLAKYFEKQVWYTDEGKSSGEVTLPENRQKLVEMILKLEK